MAADQFRAWKGAIVSVLGSRSRIRVAFAVLIVAVGSLATVFAQSQFSQPTSECGEDTVVFAMNVNQSNDTAWIDLPAGVYRAQLIADDNVTLPSVKSRYSDHEFPSIPTLKVNAWRDANSTGFGRPTHHLLQGRPVTVWSGLHGNPGGTARLVFGFTRFDPGQTKYVSDSTDVFWSLSSRWRWEIIALGVCRMPPDAGIDGLTSE